MGTVLWSQSFQSTRPIRGATTVCNVSCFGRRDFNPRAPYGARLHFCTLCRFLVCISIHAPHTGRDLGYKQAFEQFGISIHAPHTGRDASAAIMVISTSPFQSTRPIRGATRPVRPGGIVYEISIHAPHTGRDDKLFYAVHAVGLFQSTRPIRGATDIHFIPVQRRNGFQSTRPIRGATHRVARREPGSVRISIHAPHTGRDSAFVLLSLSV